MDKESKLRMTAGGKQIVSIGDIAYTWGGRDRLKVGDTVRLPGNWTTGFEVWHGQVTAMGTYYDGELVDVLGPA